MLSCLFLVCNARSVYEPLFSVDTDAVWIAIKAGDILFRVEEELSCFPNFYWASTRLVSGGFGISSFVQLASTAQISCVVWPIGFLERRVVDE